MHDFSEMMKNMMDSNYEFVDCQFISIDESSTMVVVCIDSTGEYHYQYMNEKSFYEVYGFNVIGDKWCSISSFKCNIKG